MDQKDLPIIQSPPMEISEFPNYLFHKDGYITSKKSHYKLGSISDGYTACNLTHQEGQIKKCRLHRMIYWAFSGVNPGDHEVDHINGNPQDNRFENLQLLTKKEHVSHLCVLCIVGIIILYIKTHWKPVRNSARSSPKDSSPERATYPHIFQ